jgi:hypothetical protein
MIGGLVLTFGYAPFFVALGVLDIFGAIIVWTVVRDPSKDQTVPWGLPLAFGAVLAAIMAIFVKTTQAAEGVRYYIGELTEKTFLFYPWAFYFNWALALGCFGIAAYLLFAGKKPQAA